MSPTNQSTVRQPDVPPFAGPATPEPGQMSSASSADVQTVQLVLTPAMPGNGAPEWGAARWVGAVDSGTVPRTGAIALRDSDGYHHARLLVREGAVVRGFIDVPMEGGRISATQVAENIEDLPAAPRPAGDGPLPSMTVIVCTRNRPDLVRTSLRAILALDYPEFDVVVVDNASSTPATWNVLTREFAGDRVTAVQEPRPGLSRARNTGLLRATGEIVAFTDDDVVVDPQWLRQLAAGYAAAPAVDCVTGLVPSGELRTRVQGYFDDRVTWSKSVQPRVFALDDPPADLPTFPFCVGQYGTGANVSFRRAALLALGGFDHALGVGTPTGGGEDLDAFTRILLDGRTLVVQPSALVWHRHRDDLGELRTQARGYGTGLGAWLTKLLLSPRTLRLVVARSPHALARLLTLGRRPEQSVVPSQDAPDDFDRLAAKVGRAELLAVSRGPFLYIRERWAGAHAAPLRKRVRP
jgi:cellulose synthase/poly-beta-1,6-N-acetylglucosamine synthase-like glycosyltransferase